MMRRLRVAPIGLLVMALDVAAARSDEPGGTPEHGPTDSFECLTETTRPHHEVIVPLATSEEPYLPEQALRISAGERLCVTGRLADSGELQDLVLLDQPPWRDSATVPWISFELLEDKGILVVRHSSELSLNYRATIVISQQDIAIPTSTQAVLPGLTGFETWQEPIRQLLLFGFRFSAALRHKTQRPGSRYPSSEAMASTKRSNFEHSPMSATLAFWAGEHLVQHSELDVALVREGFVPLSTTRIIGGVDLDFTFVRWRLGVTLGAGGVSSQRLPGARPLQFTPSIVAFNAGYDIVRHENFSLFATTGYAAGQVFAEVRNTGFSVLEDQLRSWEGARVRYSYGAVPLELGYEYLVPFGKVSSTEYWALQFGARGGAVIPTIGGWTTDEERDTRDLNGPDLHAIGFRYRLLLGFAVFAENP